MEKNQSKIESTSFSFFHPSSGFLRGKEEFSGLVDERVDVDVRQLRNRQRRYIKKQKEEHVCCSPRVMQDSMTKKSKEKKRRSPRGDTV